jgi:hypothetical protein
VAHECFALVGALGRRFGGRDPRNGYLGLRCRLPRAIRCELLKNELLQDTGERRLTKSNQRRRDHEPGSATIVRGNVESFQSSARKTSNDIRVIRLPVPIVLFAYKRARQGIEKSGSLAAGSFVEVAWILFKNRRHYRPSDKRCGKNVGVRCAEAFSIPLRSLSVSAPTISGLVDPRQNPNPDKRGRVASRFPRKLELVFCRERSRIRFVADLEVRDDPEHALLFLFLDLHVCQFLLRESNVHFCYLCGYDQHMSGVTQASPDCRVPEKSCDSRPGDEIVSLKGPGATLENANCPSSSDVTSGPGVWPSRVSFTTAPAAGSGLINNVAADATRLVLSVLLRSGGSLCSLWVS